MTPDELDALTRRPGPGPHRARILVAGQAVETLADLPPRRDGLLFVGLNPSPVSVAAGHYHQGRLGRTFWRRLMLAGLLPPATPVETADDALVAAGHGITDLLKLPTARDVATDAELTGGVGPLWQKIALWRPAAVVFIYKRAAVDRGRSPSVRIVGPAARRGPGRPAVLPDARTVRPARSGGPGPQLPAEPGGGAAGGSRLAASDASDGASPDGTASGPAHGRRRRRLHPRRQDRATAGPTRHRPGAQGNRWRRPPRSTGRHR